MMQPQRDKSFVRLPMALVQYVFLRTDIPTISRGGQVAQACHACVAAIFVYKDVPDTQRYLQHLSEMTKVVLKVNKAQCSSLARFLTENRYDHYEWTEQPENEVTCIALRPYDKKDCSDLLCFIRDYKLY